jgi:hypothetical protein
MVTVLALVKVRLLHALHVIGACPHYLSNTRLRYPALFGADHVGTDMRTLFTAEHLAAPLASLAYTAFLLRRTNNQALLLHDYVVTLLLSATSNCCTWPQTDVKHT